MLCCVLLAAADRSRGHMSHPWSSSTTSNKLGCRVLCGGWSIRRWAVVRQAQAVLAGALCATRARARQKTRIPTSFLHRFAFHATLQQVAAEYPDCVFVAFLDDVTVLGPPARAYAALQRLQSLAETQCDLKSDMSKCGVFSPAATDAEMDFIPAGIEGSPHYVLRGEHIGRLRGMVFVGAPVGDDEWVVEELRFIFGKLVSRLPALARMRDSGRLQVATQARTLLLRYCANPRAGFWLRMVPPHLVRRVAATFDDAIAACLRETACARGAPDDARWQRALKQARLPVRLGGLGLTSAAGQADAAWCGSWAQCWSRMQSFFPALAAIDLTTAAPPLPLPGRPPPPLARRRRPAPASPRSPPSATHTHASLRSANRSTRPSIASTRPPRPSPCPGPASASPPTSPTTRSIPEGPPARRCPAQQPHPDG